MRPAVVLVAVVLGASGCSGGGAGSPAGSNTAPPSSTLPTSGTVTYKGKVYTVAPLGSTLVLDDVSVKVEGVEWTKKVEAPLPPATSIFAVVRVTLTNTSGVTQTVAPTQIWLLDSKNHAFLASAAAHVHDPLVGMGLGPGQSATGTLVFPAPGRQSGNLLVYRFADATHIADANHVGLVRYG